MANERNRQLGTYCNGYSICQRLSASYLEHETADLEDSFLGQYIDELNEDALHGEYHHYFFAQPDFHIA